jgi:hypothetical protein
VNAAELEVRQDLRLVNRKKHFNGFQFKKNHALDHDIGPETGLDRSSLYTIGTECHFAVRIISTNRWNR